jgi:hypothetical protein
MRPNNVSLLLIGCNFHRPKNARLLLIGFNRQPNQPRARDASVHAVFNMATCAVIAGIKSDATVAINLDILKRIVVQL